MTRNKEKNNCKNTKGCLKNVILNVCKGVKDITTFLIRHTFHRQVDKKAL